MAKRFFLSKRVPRPTRGAFTYFSTVNASLAIATRFHSSSKKSTSNSKSSDASATASLQSFWMSSPYFTTAENPCSLKYWLTRASKLMTSMRRISSTEQIFLRFSLISLAKFAVKVVNRILSLSPSLLARYFALCMATTVFPVPAPPRTLAGPEKFFWTTFRWEGCKNTRHFSSGSAIILRSSSSPSTITKLFWLSGVSKAVARLSGLTVFAVFSATISSTSLTGKPSTIHVRFSNAS